MLVFILFQLILLLFIGAALSAEVAILVLGHESFQIKLHNLSYFGDPLQKLINICYLEHEDRSWGGNRGLT